MTISELIVKLTEMEEEHGSDIVVMLDHQGIEEILHVAAESGCPEYISLESE